MPPTLDAAAQVADAARWIVPQLVDRPLMMLSAIAAQTPADAPNGRYHLTASFVVKLLLRPRRTLQRNNECATLSVAM